MAAPRPASSIWLVDLNPLGLPEPSAAWQRRVFDYDKMLRVIPSQIERHYRLCRVVRREARLGLQAAILHNHPDTRACIKFGVVPVATLEPWAIRPSNAEKVIRDLRARDLWAICGGDPLAIADYLERREAEEAAAKDASADAEFDAVSTDAFRQVKYGYRLFQDTQAAHATGRRRAPLHPLPALPGRNPVANPVADRVLSTLPPGDSPAAGASSIILTD